MQYTSETMLVKSKDSGDSGIFAEISAGQAGWEYLNMAAMRLRRGESFSVETREHENATVILGGTCDIVTSDGEFKSVGRRPDVFSGMPWALYMSRRKGFEIRATSDTLEFASCWVPTDQDFPTQLVSPAMSDIELRGGGNASRQINGILPPGFN